MWSARRRLATRLIGARGLYALLLYRDFLWLTGGICSASRYFAIVRRATTMPCSPRICEMRASESGALASSAATSCLISARIAVEDAAPPASVATWLPKTYLSSKGPRGVAMYFCGVTREMVQIGRASCRERGEGGGGERSRGSERESGERTTV